MSSDKGNRHGDSPHFQMDFLGGQGRVENGDSPHSPLIRVSTRARRLSIRVYPDARVEVVVPTRVRPREVEAFITTHREWIDNRRAIALRNRPEPQRFPPAAIELRMSGEQWRLHVAGGAGTARLIEPGPQILLVTGKATDARLRASLRTWLMRAARIRLAARLAELAWRMNVKYSRVSVRRQRTRWGSCSARGTISLNCCLLFQRPEVVDYLIVHELMHVKHMNHSARFWQAVERHCAGWRVLDRELVQGWRHVPRWVFSES
jgi:predicted metal-dependent hydrolase